MTLSYMSKALSFTWKRGPRLLLFSILLHVFQGLLPGVALWIMKNLINAVTSLIVNNDHRYGLVIILMAVQFLIEVSATVAQNVQDYVNQVLSLRLDHDLQLVIAEKTTSCPAAYFEIPEFYNHLSRTSGAQGSRFFAPVSNLFDIGRALVTMSSILVFLINIHWSLVVLSVVASVPIYWIQSRVGTAKFGVFFEMMPVVREQAYLTQLLRDRQAAKEIRLFGLSDYIRKRWSERFAINAKETLHVQRKQRSANISLDSVSGLFYALAGGVIVWLLQKTSISVGSFVTVGQAVQSMQGAINSISTLLAKLYEGSLYLREFYTFLEFEKPELMELSGQTPFPETLRKGIRFENVMYKYPDSDQMILKDVSFTIEPGEKIAIVGENGSGKTTLVKCLMGLYAVTSGQIYYDDLEIHDLDRETLYRKITVIFQDFMRYPYSLRENILFGNIHKGEQTQAFFEAAVASGVDEFAKTLPTGYDTFLGKLFSEGEDLSGGQWQKVALARALFRDGDVLVLDEPTAALDPLAEMEVFRQFKVLSEGKTTFFISHRMSAARMADRILVMKQGRIVETGTHAELLQVGGEYATMYQSQAKWFAD